uniref:Uncharacterized protein n=1 Tax=Neobodo designis TaxID=312471 RepID=A0A7S1W438_NEODS|mmetsp:Transcript_51900/g.159926  ORF Transcript_51900/g.159926 Transcript_51900/m.159926 type:complete len:166 (+) Transcript_51900:103-600(+)
MGCSSSTEPTECKAPPQVPSAVSAAANPEMSREAPHPLLPTSPVVRPCTGTRPSAFVLAPPAGQAPPVLDNHGTDSAPLIDFGYVQPPPAVAPAPARLAQQRCAIEESSAPEVDGHVLLADAVGERSSVLTHARSTGSQRSDAVLGFRRSTGQSASATMCVADGL